MVYSISDFVCFNCFSKRDLESIHRLKSVFIVLFLHFCQSLSVKSCRPVNAKLSLRRSAPVQKGYELELQGPILPLSFYNLVQLMTGSQPKYFEVNMPKPSKEEFSLNVCKACDPELVQSTSKTSLSHGATVFLAAQTMGYRVLSRIVSTQGLLSFSY
eukprot:m.46480 g.46480  ORF g.46480 m.46480 type:complete len:158 (+) comp10377_c0_seq1:1213-1686(+)